MTDSAVDDAAIDAPVWAAPTPRGPVDAAVRVPGSKSLTNRWLVLAALADGPSTLRHPLRSDDSERMAEALRVLGATVDTTSDEAWTVEPPVDGFRGDVTVDCGQAGTVIRFLPPLAALARGPVRFVGHHSAQARPVGPVLDALRDLGVEVDDEGRGTLPFTVHGRGAAPEGTQAVAPAVLRVDASASSQFVSALLLAGPALPGGLVLQHTGSTLPSTPHVDMTLDVLREVGVEAAAVGATAVEVTADGATPSAWQVRPGRVRALDVTVEPDLSSAAAFLALAAVTGGRVRVRDWPASTTQPGDRMREILAALGASTEVVDGDLVAQGAPGGRLSGADLDLGEVGELTPVVAAMATVSDGPSRLRGVAHLRGHETDRLAALAAEITRVGGTARETPDGLEIEPARQLHAARLRTYHDHRMAMFAAVLGARVPGLEVEDVATAAKTFPGFDRVWSTAAATGDAPTSGTPEETSNTPLASEDGPS